MLTAHRVNFRMDYVPIFFDIETTGLNPMAQKWWSNSNAAQVTAVGLGIITNWGDGVDRKTADVDVSVIKTGDEYNLLKTLGERLRGIDYDREPFLVGYNSRNFDHPYIGARFARKRLDGEPFISEWKRLDMMRVANSDPRISKSYPKEGEYADALGVHVEDPYDGSDMPEAFERGDWDAIHTHVEADVMESVLMFLERKDLMMERFYGHYNITNDGGVVEEIDLDGLEK